MTSSYDMTDGMTTAEQEQDRTLDGQAGFFRNEYDRVPELQLCTEHHTARHEVPVHVIRAALKKI